jgi:hypothetical protein
MFLHGWAGPPLSNHTKCVFLFGIPEQTATKTVFFFTDFTRKRAHTFDKFIRFVCFDNDLYLIEMQGILLVILMALRFIDFKTSESQPATTTLRRAWGQPST